MKARSKVLGALMAGALAAAVNVVGGGVAHAAQVTTSVKPAAGTMTALTDPNACSIQTSRGFYVTAVGAGARTTDVMHTNATRIGSWEKFTFVYSGDGSHYGIRTSAGYYLTAVNSGGITTALTPDVLHSNATTLANWEKFTLVYQNDSTPTQPGTYGLQAFDGHYLTALDGGGRTSSAFNSNESTVRSWEKFRISCDV
jgi:hypothetical protein